MLQQIVHLSILVCEICNQNTLQLFLLSLLAVLNSALYVANHGVWLYMVTNSLLQYMSRNMLRYMWLYVLRYMLRHMHCQSTLFRQTHVERWYTDEQLLDSTLWSMWNQGAAEMLKKIKKAEYMHDDFDEYLHASFEHSQDIFTWLVTFSTLYLFSWTCVPSTFLFS